MWTPAQAKALLFVTMKLYLWIDLACWHAGMLCSIEDQYPPICAHSGNDVWILRLIASFVHFLRVINLLYNVEFDLPIGQLLACAPTITSYLFSIFVIIGSVGRHRLWKLHFGNLYVVGVIILGSRVRSQKQAVYLVVLIWGSVMGRQLHTSCKG